MPRARLALFAIAAALGCAPTVRAPLPTVHASVEPASPSSRPHDDLDREAAHRRALHDALPRAEHRECPIPFDDADVILARVGELVFTACDVAVADARDAREGRALRAPSEVLRSLVADALLADEARVRGLDADPVVVRRVRDTLASATVRDEALARGADREQDAGAIAEYYAAHGAEFAVPERVHLREVVLADEARARETIRDAASVPFEQLVRERTVSAEGTRDAGDLGLVPAGGNDRVSRAVADAGFALSDPGGVAPEPVRVETTVTVGHGRHAHTQTVVTWHVVQLLGREPAGVAPMDEVAPLIAHRIAFRRYDEVRAQAAAELGARLRTERGVQIDARAWRRVRVR